MNKSLLILALCALSGLARADDVRPLGKVLPTWQNECAACHLAYPPSLLTAEDWKKMMSGLDRHFGANASLEPADRAGITTFLEQNAARRKPERHSAASLRITDTPWFQREHREVASATWKSSQVKSAANCAACHPGAAQGDFEENRVRIPAAGRKG